METRERIIKEVNKLAERFLYHDRMDSELTQKMLAHEIRSGNITIDEICDAFQKYLEKSFNV
jgi:hypothetical protein